MLDMKLIRNDFDRVAELLESRGVKNEEMARLRE